MKFPIFKMEPWTGQLQPLNLFKFNFASDHVKRLVISLPNAQFWTTIIWLHLHIQHYLFDFLLLEIMFSIENPSHFGCSNAISFWVRVYSSILVSCLDATTSSSFFIFGFKYSKVMFPMSTKSKTSDEDLKKKMHGQISSNHKNLKIYW